jgi:hypothetical protein
LGGFARDGSSGFRAAAQRATNPADAAIAVVTSDHGDYLGDHWLGEKDPFLLSCRV